MLNKRILVLMFLLIFLPLIGCFPAPPNQAPIITSDPITTATMGIVYVYNVDATDYDGDTLTYSLDVKPSSMTISSATGLIMWAPTVKGNYPIIVKVSDGSLSITQSFTIKVSKPPVINQAPIIYSTPITTAIVGETYVYDVDATDPNDDTLTYSLDVKPSSMTISSATGLIMWAPTVKGNYTVVVNVSDGALSDTQGFAIIVGELPPDNQAPTINSIPSLTATVGVKYTYTIKATDPDGDFITYSLIHPPTGMTFDGIATISWIPAGVQIGYFDVTVKASDGVLSDTQSFIIVVSEPSVTPNKPPTADAGPDKVVVTKIFTVTFIGTGTDPDGTVVSYSWNFGDGKTGTGAKVSHTYSALNTYTVTLTVTDNAGATGSDTMTLKIFDIRNYVNIALSGGFQAGHFPEFWDLTAYDMTISFTYDANDLVDDGGAHAWAQLGLRTIGYDDFNPTWQVEGAGVWLATDYDGTANTFDPDIEGEPILDLDDKLILQKAGGHGEGDYNLPFTPPNPWANHAVWFDRDGVDESQAQMWGAIDGVTYNTIGTYDVFITLHATSDTEGEAYMTVNGEPQGFYDPAWHSGPADLMPAGMTFTGDMTKMQVFYGLYGDVAIHSVSFDNITVEGRGWLSYR